MCEIFVSADPERYRARARSVRLHGVVTSLRLENMFWDVLAEIAARDGLRVPQLVTRLHDELAEAGGAVENFSSFLRVCCLRYLHLQLLGGIPTDTRVSIRSLSAAAVLATEQANRRDREAPRRAKMHAPCSTRS